MSGSIQNRPRYFDTHAHLNDPRFSDDLPQVLERMAGAGVEKCVVVGSDMESSRSALVMAEKHAGLYFAPGVHPHDAKNFKEQDISEIEKMLSHPKAVAWGEIGLDYHYDFSPRTDQKSVFKRQLSRATEMQVPVILHIREAHADMLAILKAQRALPRFIAHCFSGSWETAREYLDLGGYISFAGPVTFKNAAKLPDAARNVPIDRILIETDSPYLSPEPRRGKRNEPTNVAFIAAQIARLREEDENTLNKAFWENALAFYEIRD